MARERDRKPSMTVGPETQAARLAARLQHALDSGRARKTDFEEADRIVARALASHVGNTLKTVDGAIASSFDARAREKLGRLYLRIMNLFSAVKAMESRGYSVALGDRGSIDQGMLGKLLEVDEELAWALIALERAAHFLRPSASSPTDRIENVAAALEDAFQLVEKRHLLLSHKTPGLK